MLEHMTTLQITSVEDPIARAPLLAPAVGLVRRAAGAGLLADRSPVGTLDLELVRAIAREASRAGVGVDAALALLDPAGTDDPERFAQLMTRLDAALAASPLPGPELAELAVTYPDELLAMLLGISAISLRRYVAGDRVVPDAVAARIHLLALVTCDLAGTYNELGIRQWWHRPRTALDGRSPRDALGAGWSPEDADARAVAALAAALAGPGGAT